MKRLTLSSLFLINIIVAPFSIADKNNLTADQIKDKTSTLVLDQYQENLTPLDRDQDKVLDRYDQCPNSPKDNSVDQFGCTIDTQQKTKLTKQSPEKSSASYEAMQIRLLINFDNNKFAIKDEYIADIERIANFLNKYLDYALVIEGHTSSQGSANYNQKLSQRRANQVRSILIERFSIESSRIFAVGYGEEQLLDLTETASAHKINRRIEGTVKLTDTIMIWSS